MLNDYVSKVQLSQKLNDEVLRKNQQRNSKLFDTEKHKSRKAMKSPQSPPMSASELGKTVPVINPIDQLLNIRHRIDGNGELIQDSINDHFHNKKYSTRTHEQVVRR